MLFRSLSHSEAPPSLNSSPPSSPLKMVTLGVGGVANIFLKMRQSHERVKSHHIDSNSGTPRSHPGIARVGSSSEALKVTETFVCQGGVNITYLLRATRGVVMEEAEALGANALMDEQWSCRICGPKSSGNTFRIMITYAATAVRSIHPDPHRPIALDQVKNVPGLMTIIKRNDDYCY